MLLEDCFIFNSAVESHKGQNMQIKYFLEK